MTALACALAYLGTLAAGCWYLAHRARHDETVTAVLEQVAGALDALNERAVAWDAAADEVDTLRVAAGMKPRERKDRTN